MGQQDLKGKTVRIFLQENRMRFSGLVVDQTERFLTIEDDRDHRTRIFHLDAVATIEVLHE